MTTDTAIDAEQRWCQVVSLYGQIEHELAAALQREHRLGLSEYRALSHLAVASDCELRMQDLAGALGLNHSSVSRLVARLEGEGLSRRDLCPDDRRGVFTVLTEAGRERFAAARTTYVQALTAALDRAAADPELAPVAGLLRG